MDDLPEPFGLRALVVVALDEPAILLPCFEVKYPGATDQLFQFLWLEERSHQSFVNHRVEAPLEGAKLVLALLHECVMDIEVHVFLAVLLVDEYVSALLFELHILFLAIVLHLDGEIRP